VSGENEIAASKLAAATTPIPAGGGYIHTRKMINGIDDIESSSHRVVRHRRGADMARNTLQILDKFDESVAL
jgi:hypothetical protein